MEKHGEDHGTRPRANRTGLWPKALPFASRVVLGVVFVYASLDKILDPAAFADTVNNYQILPQALVNLTAILLPWLELILGLFLILGLWLPGAVLLGNLLLVIFIGALAFNAIRGLDIHCGCFASSSDPGSGTPMAWVLLRDVIFLIVGLFLFYHTLLTKKEVPEKDSDF